MTRLVLVPSDYDGPLFPGGAHFGQAGYYLIFNDQLDLIKIIPGSPETQHGRIFKVLKSAGLSVEAVLCRSLGSHAVQIMEQYGVSPYSYGSNATAGKAVQAFFKNELRPLPQEAIHACGGHEN